ncbi:hypothetical protein ACNI3Q_05785 [Sphingomonas sp. FW199]|uniref:hypothetical protein n=1 Tax=Sphingomonas sp. FW199 TaxID=3400217 RepID=UPI003CEE5F2E
MIQRLFGLVLPKAWMRGLERESRQWIMRCVACGHGRSVWDAGGIRYGATATPRMRIRCRQCGGRLGQLRREEDDAL